MDLSSSLKNDGTPKSSKSSDSLDHEHLRMETHPNGDLGIPHDYVILHTSCGILQIPQACWNS